MPYAIRQRQNRSDFKKVEYLDLSQGQHTIRILDDGETAYVTDVHYLNGATVMCLGEDCPICANNKRIILENKEDFRKVKGYSAKSQRFIVNVLDRTNAKVCPKCGHENKKIGNAYMPICSSCNEPIAMVKEAPINKVKVLNKGVTLFDQFNGFEQSILDTDGNPVGVKNFDIVLLVNGDKKITPVPMVDKNDKVEVEDSAKFDLKQAVIKLNYDEMIQLMKGVQLRDILVARRSSVSDTKVDEKMEEIASGVSEDVQKSLNDLFKE